VAIINVQQADLLISKTRSLSLGQQLMINNQANFGLFFETVLIVIIVYVPWIGQVLGTRMLAFPHFMAPALAWFCIIVFYDEVRKIHARRGTRKDEKTGVMMYDGWIARNTLW
jgi:sodium/potassium-transporting ATPase subunit alpha